MGCARCPREGTDGGGKGCRKTAEHNAQARADVEAGAEAAIGIGKR